MGRKLVTKRGAEMAVLVPISEWRRLATAARPTLKELLLSDEARFEEPGFFERRKTCHRGPPEF
jgi:hypothetical protein